MTKEIEIKICCGTNCYITGGSELHLIRNYLPTKHLYNINTKGVMCQGHCHNTTQTKKAPIAWVNNEIITGASIEKIKVRLEKIWAEKT